MMLSALRFPLWILTFSFLSTTRSVEATRGDSLETKEETDSKFKAALPGIIGGSIALSVLVVGVILIVCITVRPRWRKWRQRKKKTPDSGTTSPMSPIIRTKPTETTPEQQSSIRSESASQTDETQHATDETQPSPKTTEWYKMRATGPDIPSVHLTEDTMTIPHHLQAHSYKSKPKSPSDLYAKDNPTEKKHTE